MNSILLGWDSLTGGEIYIPRSAFATHLHLMGGTGKGKTTCLHTILHPLLSDARDDSCYFIIDRLGNFSRELLLWMSSRFCPQRVRDRLVYIQAAREDVVPAFNPLRFETGGSAYYRVERATEIILRAWESVNIEAMPRLARWTFNAFYAASHLGLTIPDCAHFLMPGSPHHRQLLGMLPDRLKSEWEEIVSSRGSEATRILDSSRNRLKPYFESDILRRMFGASQTSLDVARLMREGRIVILDLSPRNRLSPQLGNAIGGLVINEILATARSLPAGVSYPTYLFLDEFQNFVGPDLESALPEVRQLGLRLMLSHQRLSQLERGDYDLTNMIFEAQSRLIFGLQGEDADTLAHEFASIAYNSRKVKEEIWSRRQLVSGHRREKLFSVGESNAAADQWAEVYGKGWSRGDGESEKVYAHLDRTKSTSRQESGSESETRGGSNSHTSTRTENETLVPVYESFRELSSRTYETFEEQKCDWAREIRNLPTGEALVRLVNDSQLRRVRVKRSAPGFLGAEPHLLARRYPQALEHLEELQERNFRSEFFIPAAEVDRDAEERLHRLLRLPPLNTQSSRETPPGNPQFGI